MGFDIAHLGSRSTGQPLQSADLVDHIGLQLGAAGVHVAPPKTNQIGVTHMRPHDHPALYRPAQGLQNTRRVARMKAAGNIGTGHHLQHGGIVAHAPSTKAFP